MFPYTVKYTESESDIQNINVLYKIHQQYQNTFDTFVQKGKILQKNKLVLGILYKLHNSYFVVFVIVVNVTIVGTHINTI